MKNFKELIVWQKSMDLVERVYLETKSFPNEESYGLTSQLRRCVVSVPSNIAEGFGRGQTGDYIRFLKIARGSLHELETQLLISERQGYVKQRALKDSESLINEIERMLNSLITKLETKR